MAMRTLDHTRGSRRMSCAARVSPGARGLFLRNGHSPPLYKTIVKPRVCTSSVVIFQAPSPSPSCRLFSFSQRSSILGGAHRHCSTFRSCPHCGHRPRHDDEHTTRGGTERTTASRARPATSRTMPSTNGLTSDSSHPSLAVGANSCCSARTSSTTSFRQRAQGPYTLTSAATVIRKPPATRSTATATPSGIKT